jgi:hypothetical protein
VQIFNFCKSGPGLSKLVRSIYNQCFVSGVFIPDPDYSLPDPGSKWYGIPDPQKRGNVFLTQKIVYNFSEIWSRMFIPDLDQILDMDLDFLPLPDPGIIKAPDPGSGTLKVSS